MEKKLKKYSFAEVVGECPICGSYIFVFRMWWGRTPSPPLPSCKCQEEIYSQDKMDRRIKDG